MKRFLLLVAFSAWFYSHAQEVTPDVNFGNNGFGFAVLPMQSTGWASVNTQILPDGKILVSGSRIANGDQTQDFLTRLLSNGTIDISFGINGYYIFNNNTIGDENGPDFFVLPNGKIVAVLADFAAEIICLNANGTLDNAFANNGKLSVASYFKELSPFLGADGYLYVLVLNSLKRIDTTTGAFDTTFGTAGEVFPADTAIDYIYAFRNNQFLISSYGSSPSSFGMRRFNLDGSIDNSFGVNGRLTYFSTATLEQMDGLDAQVVFDTDNNIYVMVSNYDEATTYIKKYDANGQTISGFGTNGVADVDGQIVGTSIKIHNNSLCLSGVLTAGGAFNLAIMRFSTEGTIDLSFNQTGYYFEYNNSQPQLQEIAKSLSITDAGAYIVGGEYPDGNYYKVFIGKYLASTLSTGHFDRSDIKIVNPVTNQLNIESQHPITAIELYTMDGKLIRRSNSAQLSTVDLPTGLYAAKIFFEQNNSQTFKVLKK